jgi:hypothetical protein
LDQKGAWKTHILSVTANAHRTLSFLQRNLYKCPQHLKALSYKTLVRPKLEYACCIWDPTAQSSINQLEAVQRKAARYVMSDFRRDSSVTNMINQLNWETLEMRRRKLKLTMLYKVLNNIVDVTPEQLQIAQSRIHQHRLLQPYVRTNMYHQSFVPSAVRLWNNLPASVTSNITLASFVSDLHTCISN